MQYYVLQVETGKEMVFKRGFERLEAVSIERLKSTSRFGNCR